LNDTISLRPLTRLQTSVLHPS